jgi:ParB family transcriptional regulator, chromosome partitioning protein
MGLKRIHLDQIEPNPDQPRKIFDEAALLELASSILARGLKQPVTVRPIGDDKYQLIMGERRWRAHCLLRNEGMLEDPTILAFVRRTSDEDMSIDAIVENLARADLTVLEEVQAFQRLLGGGYSVTRIAREIGVQKWRVTYRLQLVALDPIIQQMLAKGQITSPVAHEIGKLPSHTDQRRVVSLVAQGSLRNETQVRVAVEAIKRGEAQPILGDLPPAPTPNELATVSGMEARIERVLAAVAGGWKDGECVIAKQIAPGRAAVVAEKLAALRLTIKKMEDELRAAAVTGTLALQPAA